MDDIAKHYRHIMRYHFHEGLNAAETACRICKVYMPDALKNVSETLMLKQSSRLRTVDPNLHLTVKEIQEIFGMSHGSVVAHFRDADYMSRMDVWMPHELSDRKLQQRLDACDLLLEKNKQHPFLKMITGDEK